MNHWLELTLSYRLALKHTLKLIQLNLREEKTHIHNFINI